MIDCNLFNRRTDGRTKNQVRTRSNLKMNPSERHERNQDRASRFQLPTIERANETIDTTDKNGQRSQQETLIAFSFACLGLILTKIQSILIRPFNDTTVTTRTASWLDSKSHGQNQTSLTSLQKQPMHIARAELVHSGDVDKLFKQEASKVKARSKPGGIKQDGYSISY